MTQDTLQAFRDKLTARRAELKALSLGASDSRKPVELDQQSVGRLSRQDALQQQAMANAQEARRKNELKKIEAALVCIDEGDYGWCNECGEAIPEQRLNIDLTATLCAPCACAATR